MLNFFEKKDAKIRKKSRPAGKKNAVSTSRSAESGYSSGRRHLS
jgi:hypothetical protein